MIPMIPTTRMGLIGPHRKEIEVPLPESWPVVVPAAPAEPQPATVPAEPGPAREPEKVPA